MNKTEKQLQALEGAAERLISEVQQLRAAKRDLTAESTVLRARLGDADAALETERADRAAIAARVEELLRRIDQLVGLTEVR